MNQLLLTFILIAYSPSLLASETPVNKAVFIGHNEANLALLKGSPLIVSPNYKIITARRLIPGSAELHERDTDIFYILEGSATLVTGGVILHQSSNISGEIRGSDIKDGISHLLTKGDVVVIPSGVPHRFSKIDIPLLYFVVKVSH